MFRCPTCITVLPDPSARRCQICRQRIRRSGPRILGEEYRIGVKLLPIDRALNERLRTRQFTHHQRPTPHGDPWDNRFTTDRPFAPGPQVSVTTALSFDLPPAFEPERTFELPSATSLEDAIASATIAPPVTEARWEMPEPIEPDVEIDLTAPELTEEFETHVVAAAASVYEPLRVEPGPLDPDVQALVDDLYRRARSEIVGTIDTEPQEEEPVLTPDPQPARRRGWVPAVLADRKRNDGGGGNGNGRHTEDDPDF